MTGSNGVIPSQYYKIGGGSGEYKSDFSALKGSVLTHDKATDSWFIATKWRYYIGR